MTRWMGICVLGAGIAGCGGSGTGTGTGTLMPPTTVMSTTLTATAMAPLGDGSVVYAEGGRLFHLKAGPDGLSLSAVYALREDRERFATEGAKRSSHGWYLDDLGAGADRTLTEARSGFFREARSGAVDAGANARIEAAARAILAAGDATTLLEALKDKRYVARRAAALVLGEAGYGEARAVLEDVVTEKTGDGRERARALLDSLRR